MLRSPAVSPSADSGTAILAEDVMLQCVGGLRLSAASGRECDASRDGGLQRNAASGRDCVAPGDVQLRLSAASGRGRFALRDGWLSGSACSGGHCVAAGNGELRVSAAPGSERDALCDAVVAAEAGSKNRKSVVSTSDCDFDSRLTSLCAVSGRPRGVCCSRMNSCLNTHAARVNSPGLHSARGSSGDILVRTGGTYNSCGGVRGGTKPMSMSTRCQDGCPAVEKLASLQQAPGMLHDETWAGRDKKPSLPISRWWKSWRGVLIW